jgi:hypothetical protein
MPLFLRTFTLWNGRHLDSLPRSALAWRVGTCYSRAAAGHRGITDRTPRSTPTPWLELPEFRLMALALPLHLLWEIAQFPLYTVWHQNEWSLLQRLAT